MIGFLINRFLKRLFKKEIYTNGVYWVSGSVRGDLIIGKIIKTKYPLIYNVGAKVRFNLYHLPTDLVPQFEIDGGMV